MAKPGYYDNLKKKSETPATAASAELEKALETASTTDTNMPPQTEALPQTKDFPPIGQSKDLASALDKIANVIDRKLASLPVMERDFSTISEALSNEEEWKACDNSLERDHMKVDPNGRDCDPGNYYQVIHNYPMYQSSNAGENIAYVVVEKWTFAEDGASGKRKQKLGSFNMKFREFRKQYKTTLAG